MCFSHYYLFIFIFFAFVTMNNFLLIHLNTGIEKGKLTKKIKYLKCWIKCTFVYKMIFHQIKTRSPVLRSNSHQGINQGHMEVALQKKKIINFCDTYTQHRISYKKEGFGKMYFSAQKQL